MPVVFTFLLASFPAGLVIYWAWSNTLSLAQQYYIMKRQGVEVHLIGNLSRQFKSVGAIGNRMSGMVKERISGGPGPKGDADDTKTNDKQS
jgi:YidC/Oxa1 family membrane protein insertase